MVIFVILLFLLLMLRFLQRYFIEGDYGNQVCCTRSFAVFKSLRKTEYQDLDRVTLTAEGQLKPGHYETGSARSVGC